MTSTVFDSLVRANRTDRIAFSAGAILGLAIPISTAVENLGMFLLVCLIILPAARNALPLAFRHPFVIASLALYGAFVLGAFYTTAAPGEAMRELLKMRQFLLAPIVFAVCMIAAVRNGIVTGFAIGALLSLAISLAAWAFDLSLFHATRDNATAFRSHPYHNLFIGWLALGALSMWLGGRINRYGLAVFALLILVVFDIYYLVPGRTGQIIFILMFMLLLALWRGRRGAMIGLVLGLAGTILFAATSNFIQGRVAAANADVSGFLAGSKEETSVGLRLSWYSIGASIVARSPIIGHGTGSVEREYLRQAGVNDDNDEVKAKLSPRLVTHNPHSDYLRMAIQLGAVGVALFIAMFAAALRSSTSIPAEQGRMVWVIVCSIAIGSVMGAAATDNITGTGFMALLCALLAGPVLSGTASGNRR